MKIEKSDNVIKVIENDYSLSLSFQNDDMELWADMETSKKGNIITAQKIRDYLTELDLKGKINHTGIDNVCGQVRLGKPVNNIPVLSGTEPVNGDDGYIKFLAKPSEEAPNYDPESRENIDYHNLHLFDNVKNGQAIAEIVKSTRGVNGENLKGQITPAKKGEDIKITLGDGVRMGVSNKKDERPNFIYAKRSGRIEYTKTSKNISVTNKYIVSGNAGFQTGNIDFVGFVEISGDVTNGFNVKGDKGVFIKGNIENSKIESKGNIEVGGGITGKSKGFIKSGGSLSIRYIDNSNIEVIKNLEVKNEIIDSIVKVRGSITVTKGAIIGGNVLALSGIEARTLGSDIGVKTILTSGKCFISDNKIAILKKELTENTSRLKEISDVIDKALRHPKKGTHLTAEDKLKLRKISIEFTALTQRNCEIPEEIDKIEKYVKDNANYIINIWRNIEKNVEIHLGTHTLLIEDTVNKKMTIVENSRNNKMRFIDMIPLTENARHAERDIARKEKQEEEKV